MSWDAYDLEKVLKRLRVSNSLAANLDEVRLLYEKEHGRSLTNDDVLQFIESDQTMAISHLLNSCTDDEIIALCAKNRAA